MAIGAEKLANRLVDDALAAQESMREQVNQHEFRITEIFSYIAQSDEESLNKTAPRSKAL